MERSRADALLVLELPATVAHRRRIGELAAQQRLPTLFAGGFSDAGGLLGYGTRVPKAARRLAAYVDRIVKGAQPADLPFEVVVRPELIVNLKTAQEIGVTIPPEVLKRATGSYNEGLSYQLDNRRDRAAEPPPAAFGKINDQHRNVSGDPQLLWTFCKLGRMGGRRQESERQYR